MCHNDHNIAYFFQAVVVFDVDAYVDVGGEAGSNALRQQQRKLSWKQYHHDYSVILDLSYHRIQLKMQYERLQTLTGCDYFLAGACIHHTDDLHSFPDLFSLLVFLVDALFLVHSIHWRSLDRADAITIITLLPHKLFFSQITCCYMQIGSNLFSPIYAF